jgi:acyl-CoA-binding protein
MAKSNKFTLAKLNAIDNKNNQRKTIYVTPEKYEVNIHTHFRESLMEDVVTEYIALVEELRNKTELDDVMIRGTLSLFNVLVMKKFTDLPFPKKMDLGSLIAISRKFMDNGITNEVINSFPKEETDKLEQRFKVAQQNAAKIIAEMAVTSVAQAQEISDAN